MSIPLIVVGLAQSAAALLVERELADGLTTLFVECRTADQGDGRGGGPGSRVYDFYDGGLGMILEVASERAP